MSDITKYLLLGLTAACIVAILVFTVQLIVINRGVEPIDRDVAAGSAPEAEVPDDEEDYEPEPTPVATPMPTLPPRDGTREELRISVDKVLVIYYEPEVFDFVQGELDWQFLHRATAAGLEIEYMVLTPAGLTEDGLNYLNAYMGGEGAEFGGEENIHGSLVSGFHLHGRQDERIYEAWIYTFPGGELAIVFVINYTNPTQRDALYSLLSTMEIIQRTLGDDPTPAELDTQLPPDDDHPEDDIDY